MFSIRLLFFFLISISILSCDKEDDFVSDPHFKFTFSTDTVAFDTLFTGFESTTKQLKIYNPSSKAVKISSIYLYKTETPYRINVNGKQSNLVQNIELNAKDSLYVFVEVSLSPKDEDAPRLLKDQIVIEANGNVQRITLETFAQDVHLIDEDITESAIWTGNRPYVLLKPTWLTEGTELSIQEGAKIYFYKDAGIHVKGKLSVNGTFERPVYFGSTRLEELYENAPGQWDGIYFYEESTSSVLEHFVLEDGINGLSFDRTMAGVPVNLSYAFIRNFSQNGISAKNASIIAHDLLVTNCGQECLRMEGDAIYEIYQSTFYNLWSFSPRTDPVIFYKGTGEGNLKISNSIVWSGRINELEVEPLEKVEVENTLLKLGSTFQLDYAAVFKNCIFNENPLFIDLTEFDFGLQVESPAINKGNIELNKDNWLDLNANRRDQDIAPDMGAYEYFEMN
ncbi:hypothetical protein L3049_08065 [Labilibaculum sp. DW002]|uniref:Right handed beta helix domain-containing protein n=1 Tax=Paralabilibaculum antarcticum TaxID=2912572 RepID=A0ABT5VRQ1_9BACT|nr:choice-of-anchor Q domain-containing protein [Labilibaculum sp. DW002]MDE5417961.1 hypothetical protein [Labilibaculum sp. DW002]